MVQLIEIGSPAYAEIIRAAIEQATKTAIEYAKSLKEEDEVGGVELAMKVTGYRRSTVYNKTSSGALPSHKDENQKTFYVKSELIEKMKK